MNSSEDESKSEEVARQCMVLFPPMRPRSRDNKRGKSRFHLQLKPSEPVESSFMSKVSRSRADPVPDYGPVIRNSNTSLTVSIAAAMDYVNARKKKERLTSTVLVYLLNSIFPTFAYRLSGFQMPSSLALTCELKTKKLVKFLPR